MDVKLKLLKFLKMRKRLITSDMPSNTRSLVGGVVADAWREDVVLVGETTVYGLAPYAFMGLPEGFCFPRPDLPKAFRTWELLEHLDAGRALTTAPPLGETPEHLRVLTVKDPAERLFFDVEAVSRAAPAMGDPLEKALRQVHVDCGTGNVMATDNRRIHVYHGERTSNRDTNRVPEFCIPRAAVWFIATMGGVQCRDGVNQLVEFILEDGRTAHTPIIRFTQTTDGGDYEVEAVEPSETFPIGAIRNAVEFNSANAEVGHEDASIFARNVEEQKEPYVHITPRFVSGWPDAFEGITVGRAYVLEGMRMLGRRGTVRISCAGRFRGLFISNAKGTVGIMGIL
jgi:hypothetical protein